MPHWQDTMLVLLSAVGMHRSSGVRRHLEQKKGTIRTICMIFGLWYRRAQAGCESECRHGSHSRSCSWEWCNLIEVLLRAFACWHWTALRERGCAGATVSFQLAADCHLSISAGPHQWAHLVGSPGPHGSTRSSNSRPLREAGPN